MISKANANDQFVLVCVNPAWTYNEFMWLFDKKAACVLQVYIYTYMHKQKHTHTRRAYCQQVRNLWTESTFVNTNEPVHNSIHRFLPNYVTEHQPPFLEADKIVNRNACADLMRFFWSKNTTNTESRSAITDQMFSTNCHGPCRTDSLSTSWSRLYKHEPTMATEDGPTNPTSGCTMIRTFRVCPGSAEGTRCNPKW